ncbi:MAG TPA: hypothetical protein VM571_09665 [Noviherbaspirillum sp.]|nr:hypothetical protein [Noviherbaspirillum sp.]
MSGVNKSSSFNYGSPPAVPAPTLAQPANAADGLPPNARSGNPDGAQMLTAPPPLRKWTSFIANQLRKQLSQATLGIVDASKMQESAALSPKPQGTLRKTLSSLSLNPFKSTKQAAAVTKEVEDGLATAAVQHCLERLKQSSELDETTCHTSTKVVSKALCGVELQECHGGSLETLDQEFKQHHKPDQKTVYRIDVSKAGHSLAVARCGNKAVIVQSWADLYSIKDWLEGTKPELSKNPSLPKHGPVDITAISDQLNSISSSLKNGDVDSAHTQATAMFNPFGGKAARMGLGLRYEKEQTGLTTKWSSAPMLNDEAPGAAR